MITVHREQTEATINCTIIDRVLRKQCVKKTVCQEKILDALFFI